MDKKLVVIVDADALIAQVNTKDAHHANAMIISEKLIAIGAKVIYPATVIAEANAYIQRVLNNTAGAYEVARKLVGPQTQVAEVSKEVLREAVDYFSPKTSKKNTLFDCIVVAIAKQHAADAIFSFDKFYKKKGFKLASEL